MISVIEKQVIQSPKRSTAYPGPDRYGWQISRGAGEGKGKGAARKGKGGCGKTQKGGSRVFQARAVAKGAAWRRPQDGVVCLLQDRDLRQGDQVQV